MTKQQATDQALAWSKRVDLPAYIYKTARGWEWAADKIIAHAGSVTGEIIDANPVRIASRLLGQRGGSAKSEAKAAASRANGRKGGRPRTKPRA